jgi:hypothetical protein
VFIVNVLLFPLGLAGISSPAASPFPGHLLVEAFPWLHRLLPITAAVLGALWLGRRFVRRPPGSSAEVCLLAGWVMLIAILVAPATRIGYLVYPINFFMWSSLFRGADESRLLDELEPASPWDRPLSPNRRPGTAAA